MTRRWCFTAIFGCFLLLNGILAIRIKDNIYTDLNERAFCFRRTNGTHQMGCSSDLNGNVGVIHLVSSPEDLQWLLTKGIHDPYVGKTSLFQFCQIFLKFLIFIRLLVKIIRFYFGVGEGSHPYFTTTFTKRNLKFSAILTPTMFNKDTMTRLKKSDKISGMLLLGVNNTIDILKPPNKHSDDSSCPNQESSLYRREDSSSDENCQAEQNPWNPEASDILFQDWSIPLFLIDDPKIVDRLLNECYERFNKPDQDGNPRSWPLCAVEMKAHMYAAVDTKTCQRRNRLVNPFSPTHICDPLGDRNIFHLFSQNFDNQSRFEDRSILLVSARLDTINTFDKVETGLDSPSTGIVTLLAAAEMLAKSQFKPQDGKNVLFGLLNGE
jgi:nicastrin